MDIKEEKESYYSFDDKNKEVVFHRYDMPSPWMNYLTNGTFFTMISQAGGSLSWYKSPEIWRIGRYNFFNVPTDGQGLFIYIKDLSTGKVFNPTCIPRKEELDFFESRHGLGYTKFIATKDDIKVEIKAFVGEENALIYKMNISSSANKDIKVFAVREMANMEYLREVQWECYTKNSNHIKYLNKSDSLLFDYFIDGQPREEETPYVFFTSNIKPNSYTGVRKDFLGNYRDFKDPISVDNGYLPNTELYGGESIFALQYDISLKEKEDVSLDIVLGATSKQGDFEKDILRFKNHDFINQLEIGLSKKWDNILSTFKVKTNDPQLDRMTNIWNPYQIYNVYYICREISYYATGSVRGMGVRDGTQDAISNVIYDKDKGINRLLEIMSEQYQDGHTNNYYYHIEKKPSLTNIKSDNHLWMIYLAYEIFNETGDVSFLKMISPFYDGGEDTIYHHLINALKFTMNNLGEHNLPLMFGSDWNDALTNICKNGKGESVMVAEQVVLAAKEMKEMAIHLNEDVSFFKEIIKKETVAINTNAFEGEWYARAFTDSGFKVGGKDEPYGKVWLNSNAWAVLSEISNKDVMNKCMNSVINYLDSEFGLLKLYPALVRDYPTKEEEITFAAPGIGENGGIFCHANTWAIMALCKLSRYDEAFVIYKKLIPDNIISKIGVNTYNAEPYIYSSNIRAPYVTNGGQAGVSWVTGTATWMNIALQQYIFGIKPHFEGLEINPGLPSHIKTATVERIFRGSKYIINIHNNPSKDRKVVLVVNGKPYDKNIVEPFAKEIKIDCFIK